MIFIWHWTFICHRMQECQTKIDLLLHCKCEVTFKLDTIYLLFLFSIYAYWVRKSGHSGSVCFTLTSDTRTTLTT